MVKKSWKTTNAGQLSNTGSPAQLLTFGPTVNSATSVLPVTNAHDYALAVLAKPSPVILKLADNSNTEGWMAEVNCESQLAGVAQLCSLMMRGDMWHVIQK